MRRSIAIALVTGLLLAGCGDDDEEEPAATQSEAPAQTQADTQGGTGGEAVRVVLSDFAIDPATPTVEAGPVTFDIVNEGQAPHRLEVEGNGIEEVSETLDSEGETTTLEVDLEPGDYEWYCPVGNHRELGMDGTLTVE